MQAHCENIQKKLEEHYGVGPGKLPYYMCDKDGKVTEPYFRLAQSGIFLS